MDGTSLESGFLLIMSAGDSVEVATVVLQVIDLVPIMVLLTHSTLDVVPAVTQL